MFFERKILLENQQKLHYLQNIYIYVQLTTSYPLVLLRVIRCYKISTVNLIVLLEHQCHMLTTSVPHACHISATCLPHQ